MKKILLASTALLVGGMVSAQAAEPIKLSLGGFMKQQIILADNQNYMHEANVDQQGFGQVNFTGSTKLDNGLTIGVAVETLATQYNDSRNASGARGADLGTRAYGNTNVRRAYLTASSNFGQLILGQREDYGFITGVYAPDVGWGAQDGDWTNFINIPGSHSVSFTNNNSRYNSRAEKITVVTPTLAGFSAGVSYVPSIQQSWTGDTTIANVTDALSGTAGTSINGVLLRQDLMGDMYQGGLSYKNTLGPVGVAANYAFSQYNMANLQTHQAGANLTYAGFTLGGSLFSRVVGDKEHITYQTPVGAGVAGTLNNSATKAMMRTGLGWEAGLSYAFDAFAVSGTYFHDTTKRDGASDAAATGSLGGMADSTQVYALSGKYTMGPGVELRNTLYYVDYKNNNNYAGADDTQKSAANNSGLAFITGLQVAF